MRLFAGRSAEIHDFEPGWVLKTPMPGFEIVRDLEAANYKALEPLGLPMPRCRGLASVADGEGLVLEKIVGPSMRAEMQAHPERQGELAELFLKLWERIHQRAEAEILTIRGRIDWCCDRAQVDRPEHLPAGEAVICHFDFHPDNVILSEAGPVVIDWVDALLGPVEADEARTLLLLGFPFGPDEQPSTFARAVYESVMTRRSEQVRAWIPLIARARLGEGFEGAEADRLRAIGSGELSLP